MRKTGKPAYIPARQRRTHIKISAKLKRTVVAQAEAVAETMKRLKTSVRLPQAMSHAEDLLVFQIKAAKLPMPVREFSFNADENWKSRTRKMKRPRFDLAWPDPFIRIAAEIEGGSWSGGRHTRGAGFEEDCKKYNQAQLQGWIVYRFTTNMVKNGEALDTIEKAIKQTWRK